MLRKATFSVFVHETRVIRETLPLHRTGAALFVCNYSTAARQVYLDWSANGTTWTAATVTWQGGSNSVVPYGIIIGTIAYPSLDSSAWYLRIRLDSTADGNGVYVQLESASPVPDYLLM